MIGGEFMTDRLTIDLEPKAYPYPHDPGADRERWGRITVSIATDGRRIVVLKTEWDLNQFVQWLGDNRNFLCHDELSIEGNGPLDGESLAEALSRFREREFSADEDEAEARWFDAVYQYYLRHGLRMALRGSRLPDIIIGYNHGNGEISRADAQRSPEDGPDEHLALPGPWAFAFDIDAFCADLQGLIGKVAGSRIAHVGGA
jgi:hypothetical protein